VSAPVSIGQVETEKRVFVQSDFDRFAALSGDDNPIHIDPDFSARTRFGRTVAHGMFLYSTVCGVLGTHLPGPGTIQIEQELMFPTATPTSEEVEVRVEVTAVQPAEGLVDLTTLVIRPHGERGLQGRTLVQLPGFPISNDRRPDSSIPDSRSPGSHSFKGVALGQRAQTQRTFSATDLAEYASLAGDANPVFIDLNYVRELGLDGLVVPGGLLGALSSFLLGTELPGRGTNYLKQRLYFSAPAYVGQELTASVQVVRIRPEKQLVNLRTLCTDAEDSAVCHGEALVLVSDVARVP
jgi:acyl dehydratase